MQGEKQVDTIAVISSQLTEFITIRFVTAKMHNENAMHIHGICIRTETLKFKWCEGFYLGSSGKFHSDLGFDNN